MKMTLKNPEEIKVFILYLLDSIGYPLSYSDLGTVVIRDGVVDYFAYFEYFSELVEAGHISPIGEDGNPLYDARFTDEAIFNGDIPDAALISGENVITDSRFERPSGEDLSNPDKKYVVTTTGRGIARGLSDSILMSAVREKSYESAMRHLSLEKQGATCDQTFERDGDGFMFHCKIEDKEGVTMDLSLRAETVNQLNRMRMTFDDRPDIVLRGIVALLTGNVNYLFEE